MELTKNNVALDGRLHHSGRRKKPQNTLKNGKKNLGASVCVCVCVDAVEDAAVGFMQ